jgi:hypothetical protein
MQNNGMEASLLITLITEYILFPGEAMQLGKRFFASVDQHMQNNFTAT